MPISSTVECVKVGLFSYVRIRAMKKAKRVLIIPYILRLKEFVVTFPKGGNVMLSNLKLETFIALPRPATGARRVKLSALIG